MSATVSNIIESRDRDLGGFSVRRVIPAARQRTVGPFVFFDHMGPATFPAGQGIDVRPHPHIGIATVTYLFEGEILHRDSLGYEQAIRPGDVNWMTAGRGIVHSERESDEARKSERRLNGIQSWIGLPKADEETDPGFFHYPAESLPEISQGTVTLRLIAGSALGLTAPTVTFSDMFYIDASIPADETIPVPNEHEERAVYVAGGKVTVAEETLADGNMAILEPGAEITVSALEDSRVMLLGGEPLDGLRHVWWNFVSSSQERIELAKADWKEGRFASVPGDDEFIPLPEN